LTSGCRERDTPEVAKERVRKAFLERQVQGLRELREKARRGELVTTGQIALGVDEGVAREILNVALPLERDLGQRLRIRIESAEPFFRGTQAALLFRARATSLDLPDAFAELELGGALHDVKLSEGRLSATVALLHFRVLHASVGPLAQGALEGLMRSNLALIQDIIPPFEIPVGIEQEVRLGRFQEGPFEAAGGRLPLEVKVSQVLALRQRLWVLLEAKAGPWRPLEPEPAEGAE
jgi:hypothetical protein